MRACLCASAMKWIYLERKEKNKIKIKMKGYVGVNTYNYYYVVDKVFHFKRTFSEKLDDIILLFFLGILLRKNLFDEEMLEILNK